jgi:hypothetical protein
MNLIRAGNLIRAALSIEEVRPRPEKSMLLNEKKSFLEFAITAP